MKFDKEYPATHSMETNWFICDCDGNVAAVEFGDDGPQPLDLPDTFADDLIFEEFVIKNDDGLDYIPLTDEQADDLIDMCKPFELNEDNSDYVWLIHSKSDLIKQMAHIGDGAVVLSYKKGLIIYRYLNHSISEFNKLIEDGCILGGFATNIDYWHRVEDTAPLSDNYNNFYKLFLYAYSQAKESDGRIVLDYTPRHPFNIRQLPQVLQDKVVHVNTRFGDDWAIQLAEYIPVATWGINEDRSYYLDNYLYTRFKDNDGKYAFYPLKKEQCDFYDVFDKNMIHVPDDYKGLLGGVIEFNDMKYIVENYSSLAFEENPQ